MLCQTLPFMSFIITALAALGLLSAALTIRQGLRDIREGRSLITGRAK